MKSQKTLFCFTSSYPFGMKETYFENELKYLAKAFDKIYIQPTYNPFKSKSKRKVPPNVIVLDPVVPVNKAKRILLGTFSLAPSGKYFADFFKAKAFLSRRNTIHWLNSFFVFRILYSHIKVRFRKLPETERPVIYYYWGEAPLLMTKLLKSYLKVVRMHRADFYVEVNNGYLPVRDYIYRAANLLVPISKDISVRLQRDYKISKDKIFINYLGVDNPAKPVLNLPSQNIIRIVSCSRVDPIKRVQIISDIVEMWDGVNALEWHHFGDGIEYDELKSSLKKRGIASRCYLHGWKSQNEIFNFYENNYVTWFVNVSLHEGVPVSIMEALSFGIPVIATDVGATSEIVNSDNGYLVSKDITRQELVKLVASAYDKNYLSKRKEAYHYWRKRFNANDNYGALMNKIDSLLYEWE